MREAKHNHSLLFRQGCAANRFSLAPGKSFGESGLVRFQPGLWLFFVEELIMRNKFSFYAANALWQIWSYYRDTKKPLLRKFCRAILAELRWRKLAEQ